MSPWTAGSRAALDQLIQFQATIFSDIDDAKLMMLPAIKAAPMTAFQF